MDDLDTLELGLPLMGSSDLLDHKYDEWIAARAGRFTCSRFGDLMVSGRRKDEEFGQVAMSYIFQVAAERRGSLHSFSSHSTEWGHEHEPAAVEIYQKRVTEVVSYDPHKFLSYTSAVGGSPDGLVGDDGVIEIKCPFNPGVHIRTVFNRMIPKEYIWQVHGHLLVTGRKWCDFISFDPRITGNTNMVVIRQERDEKKIDYLNERLHLALAKLAEVEAKLNKDNHG